MLTVETATGVNREILRPDLFGAYAAGDVDEVDAARAQEYALLAALLARAPDAALLKQLSELRGDASPLGMAHVALAEAASAANVEAVEREYFDLFIGIGRGELLPYGSYYLTGFLHERPLARLRGDLIALGIERVEGNIEPEDHAAMLCEIMAGLIGGLCRRRRAPTRTSSRSIWRPGSGASSPIWSKPKPQSSIEASARSAARSSTSRRRRFRCRRERAADANGNPRRERNETTERSRKSRAATSFARSVQAQALRPLPPRRSRTGAKADTENNDEKRKARYKETDHVKAFYRVNRYPTK